ncbi:hypothetical protein SUGI_0359170 [Cryptomeria japonica]|nr:hypothetical protein SUGI_0359170 [Cryptomeria japonica]
MMDDSMHSYDNNVPQKSQFYVGLEKCIGDLKGLWFQGHLLVVDVQGVYSHDGNVSGKSEFYVWLDKCIGDLKGLLFNSKVLVVGVHCMGGHDAFAILSELASRNLLNLTSNSRGSTTIPNGNALELHFSQLDAMQDLV